MIFYKVGDPNQTVSTPNVIWDANAGRAGLDEISFGNDWQIANVGNATALWNAADMTTLTINFNTTEIGNTAVVTVASNSRELIGVNSHDFISAEWQEEINETIQSTMVSYFVENGDWTLNDNGVKATSAPGFSQGYWADALTDNTQSNADKESAGIIARLDAAD